jgi:PBP1b-binding outer membrane lipoprotein LpoB
MTRKLPFAVAAALLTVGLGGCSRSDDETAPAENYTDAAPQSDEQPVAPPPTVAPEAAPTETGDTNTTALAAPDAAPPAPDEQMMDDASATGMTSRTSRGERADNETAPSPAPDEPIETK